MATAVPSAIRALQASLKAAREPELRQRIETALSGLRRLYGVSESPDRHRDTDLRKRPKAIGRPGLRPSQQRRAPPEAASAYRREWRDRIAREEKL
jgi:hypothetical protein